MSVELEAEEVELLKELIPAVKIASGGLVSYGPNSIDQYRGATEYADRILLGEKPADPPVQSPNKVEIAIHLKTAEALVLNIPRTLISRADEVIE